MTIAREKNENNGITDCGICHELNDQTYIPTHTHNPRLYREMDIFRVTATNNKKLGWSEKQWINPANLWDRLFSIRTVRRIYSIHFSMEFNYNSLLIRQTIGLSSAVA